VCVTPLLAFPNFPEKRLTANLVIRSADVYSGPRMLTMMKSIWRCLISPKIGPAHRRERLASHNLCLDFRRGPALDTFPDKPEQYLSAKHILTSFSGDAVELPTRLLQCRACPKNLVATQEFSSTTFLLLASDTVATLPAYAAKTYAQRMSHIQPRSFFDPRI